MMNKYTPERTAKFKKDYKRLRKRGLDMSKLDEVIVKLANGETLEPKHRDHALVGNRNGFRDCHIEPDWILIYKLDNGKLILILSETGSHADLLE
jgi:mRNA interferase YafQ